MNNLIIRKLLFKVILVCHSSKIRIFIYRFFFNYTIGKNVRIDKCIISCESVSIGDNVILRDNNLFKCKRLEIGNKTEINSNNTVLGYSNFIIGYNSRIMNHHYFDVWNNIIIGNNTWIAGRNSQFWTHGSTQTKLGKDLSINIGNDIYISSDCKLAPGIKISDINLISLGSVITQNYETNKNIIAGNPSSIIKTGIDWRKNW
ncbi:MAG: hypothetical protein CMP12_07120 [Zunongwangia sp.]|jgi:acetyltransferase-like isoleucine patch superfamily enzyme|uniref:acyltransferase n=1 Tax=Zunongwangia profunda TaxID=398743 RepID=UPI000C949503|nr:hypothetical protein [Zunongwangia profunda]MAG89034.1 hypothetical protein [Flavobacteriaceae bacterium]MAO35675.1 hypothetical protein [Zunongwangia sp.]MCC4230172.1 hypothetical protein [Zunongwangia profunda]|tara:strand:- start:16441 stop:17049 length:609 start_codon:yes stop_codon:yes gene_type:complete